MLYALPFEPSSRQSSSARVLEAPNTVVQWGKEEGPYARLRALGEGEGDSRFGAANRENSSCGSEKRVDNRDSGELHRGQ